MSRIQTGGHDYKVVSFEEATDRVLDERRAREDIQIPLKKFSLSLSADGEKIVGCIDGRDYVPTMHCLKQMATIMDVSHAVLKKYVTPKTKTRVKKKVKFEEPMFERDQTDRELLVALFKNGIREGRVDPEKEFKFRTYQDGTLRAMVTDKYAYIDNVWYIKQLQEAFAAIGGDEPGFVHWRGNADTLYGNLLIPDSMRSGSDSDHGGMLGISNCEIGKRRLGLAASIFRSLCTNGCVFGLQELDKVSQVHRGNVDLIALRHKIFDGISTAVPKLDGYIDKFIEMQDKKLEVTPSAAIAQVAQDFKLTTGAKGQAATVVKQYGQHENSHRNLFGIVNAITRTAQLYDPHEHVRLDVIGGNLLNFDDGKWERFNKRAAGMDEETHNQIFGIVVPA